MATDTEVIQLTLEANQLNIKVQKAKDKIADIKKAMKDFNLTVNERKQLIIRKTEAERNLKSLQKELKKTEKDIVDVGKASKTTFSQMALGFSLAMAGARRLYTGVKTYLVAAKDQVVVQFQIAQALRSTGNAAGTSRKELNKFAKELSQATGVNKTYINNIQAMLLTFTEIGGDKLPRATEAILDISKVMKIDAKNSAIQVGKALNDPIKGLTSLVRVGVTFTKQQKEQIKGFVAINDIAAAQGVILSELEREFGGVARATKTALDEIAVAYKEMQEKIGAELLQTLGKDGSLFTNLFDGISKFVSLAIEGFRIIGMNIGVFVEGASVQWTNFINIGSAALMAYVNTVSEAFKTVYNIGYDTFENLGRQIFDLLNGGDSAKSYSDIWKDNLTKSFNSIKAGWTVTSDKMIKAVKELDFEFLKFDSTLGETKETIDDTTESVEKQDNAWVELTKKQKKFLREYQKIKSEFKDDEDATPEELSQARATKDLYEFELALLEEYHALKLISTESYEKQLIELKEKYANYQKEKDKASLQDYANVAASILGSITDAMSSGIQTEQANLTASYDEDVAKLKESKDNKLLTEKEYDEQLAKLDKERDKDIKELNKEKKKIAIAQAYINTSVGVTKSLELPFPLNWIQAIAVGAAGLYQVNQIKKQKLARGGVRKLDGGGVLKGPSHSQGGIQVSPTQEAEGDEIILNRSVYRNSLGRKMASLLNTEIGNGVAFDSNNRTRSMANGGVINNNSSTTDNASVVKSIERLRRTILQTPPASFTIQADTDMVKFSKRVQGNLNILANNNVNLEELTP